MDLWGFFLKGFSLAKSRLQEFQTKKEIETPQMSEASLESQLQMRLSPPSPRTPKVAQFCMESAEKSLGVHEFSQLKEAPKRQRASRGTLSTESHTG